MFKCDTCGFECKKNCDAGWHENNGCFNKLKHYCL